jgi:hypothetical protein
VGRAADRGDRDWIHSDSIDAKGGSKSRRLMFDLPRFRCATQITNQFPLNIVAAKKLRIISGAKKRAGLRPAPTEPFFELQPELPARSVV